MFFAIQNVAIYFETWKVEKVKFENKYLLIFKQWIDLRDYGFENSVVWNYVRNYKESEIMLTEHTGIQLLNDTCCDEVYNVII